MNEKSLMNGRTNQYSQIGKNRIFLIAAYRNKNIFTHIKIFNTKVVIKNIFLLFYFLLFFSIEYWLILLKLLILLKCYINRLFKFLNVFFSNKVITSN